MAKYLDQNGLLYFWQKIVSKFVAKESGKGLSTNDYTTEEKNKLAGLNNYTLPTASAETLGGVKVGSGLTISDGVLNATGGGTADSVDWSNIQNKPDTFTPATHDHDDTYLKLSGGTMTGPIQFSADQGQIKVDATAAEARIEMDTTAAEIIFNDKQNTKTNRVSTSANGVTIVAGETSTSDFGAKIEVDPDGYINFRVGSQHVLEAHSNGLNALNKNISHVATPTDTDHATNKGYVDSIVSTKANTTDVYAKTETYSKTEVDSKLSAVYKPGGSVLFSELPTPNATSLGFVYNLKEAFITDDRFLASTPVPYPIGTDVAVVAVPGDPVVYKFDVMAGFVDLSGYLKTADMVSITNQEIDTVVS